MKSLLIVYHNINTEARSQETCDLLKKYGQVICVSYATYQDDAIKGVSNRNGKKSLLSFLINAARTIRSEQPDLIVLHDEYPMVLVPYIKSVAKKAKIIHDSSELYLLTNRKKGKTSLKSEIARLFLYCVKRHIHKVDLVLAANKERAQIMKTHYGLEKLPLVFDNIHKIEGDYNQEECDRKFAAVLNGKTNVLYAGGISENRMTYLLAEQFGALASENVQLLIVGMKEHGAEEKLQLLLTEKHITNVQYLGFVSREELKYLMEKSSITISTFAMDTPNNINCASGKVYEGLFLGKPLLAGINPPLKRLCEEHKVGVSTQQFADGCRQILSNYAYYQENVQKYINSLDYAHKLDKLKEEVDRELFS